MYRRTHLPISASHFLFLPTVAVSSPCYRNLPLPESLYAKSAKDAMMQTLFTYSLRQSREHEAAGALSNMYK